MGGNENTNMEPVVPNNDILKPEVVPVLISEPVVEEGIIKEIASDKQPLVVSEPDKPEKELGLDDFDIPELSLENGTVFEKSTGTVENSYQGALQFGIIGLGQCGSRIAASFEKLGYKKSLAINTARQDLHALKFPEGQKLLLDIGMDGAGKDMLKGAEAAKAYKLEIMNLIENTFGENIDKIIISFGIGGGTGSGAYAVVKEYVKEYFRNVLGREDADKCVCTIVAYPSKEDLHDKATRDNVVTIMEQLKTDNSYPLLIVDNDKIKHCAKGLTVSEFWPFVNNQIAGLFHRFNLISSLPSQYESFDTRDYLNVLNAGAVTIMGVLKADNSDDLSLALKNNLYNTLLSTNVEFSSIKVLGCIIVGGKNMFATEGGLADKINKAFGTISTITKCDMIHNGIYEDSRECIRVYTIASGLQLK